MKGLLRWRVLLLSLALLVALGPPVLADGGAGGRVIFGDSFTLGEGQRLNGDLVVFGGDVALLAGSSVRGDVAAFGGSVRVEGQVDGQVYAFGGDVRLGPNAIVTGDVATSGDVMRAPGAVVRGKVMPVLRRGVRLPLFSPWRGLARFGWPLWQLDGRWGLDLGRWLTTTARAVVNVLLMVALGALVVLLAPEPARRVGGALVTSPLPSLGVGLLTGVAAVLVVPILVITCFGIPVALLLVLILAIALLFGWIAAGLVVGERLLAAANAAERQPVLGVALGILALGILSALPCLGFLVRLAAGAWGLGAVVLTRFGTQSYVVSPPAPLPPLPEPPEAAGGA